MAHPLGPPHSNKTSAAPRSPEQRNRESFINQHTLHSETCPSGYKHVMKTKKQEEKSTKTEVSARHLGVCERKIN